MERDETLTEGLQRGTLGPSTIAGLDSLDWTGGGWIFHACTLVYVYTCVPYCIHVVRVHTLAANRSSMIIAESPSVASKVICLDNSPNSVRH